MGIFYYTFIPHFLWGRVLASKNGFQSVFAKVLFKQRFFGHLKVGVKMRSWVGVIFLLIPGVWGGC